MAYRGADGVAAPCGSLLARPSTTAGDAGLPILATDMTACVPCLVVYVRGSLSETDSEDLRSDPTRSAPTPARLAISRSLHLPHSSSCKSVRTARRLSSFVRRSPWEASAHHQAMVAMVAEGYPHAKTLTGGHTHINHDHSLI